ncbi:MAG: hypothetical protein HS132_13305 [Planctomycetia bacterium]|nr:hypothetical protein [Planctomycetia bacterium]
MTHRLSYDTNNLSIRERAKIHIPQSSFVVTINALCFAATHDILGEIVHRALPVSWDISASEKQFAL